MIYGNQPRKRWLSRCFYDAPRTGCGACRTAGGETNTTCSRGDQEDENPPACSTAWPDGRRESEDYICFKKIADDWEGCLSFPGVRGMVPRHESITVEYYDRMGAKKRIVLRGFQARVFQHEIDHLNGILYTDRMTDMKTLMTADEFKKRAVKKGGLKSR